MPVTRTSPSNNNRTPPNNPLPPADRNSTRRRVPVDSVPLKSRRKMAEQMFDDFRKRMSETDALWEVFDANNKMHDNIVAPEYLDKYIIGSKVSVYNFEDFCYELFLDFSKGRKGIKSDAFAEMTANYLGGNRDFDKLLALTEFFKKINKRYKADDFYYTLAEIFYHGTGVRKDLNKAAEYMKTAIDIKSDEPRRNFLLKVYKEQNAALDDDAQTRMAYEKMINEKIDHAKKDYAKWLQTKGKDEDAIPFFLEDKEFDKAYNAVDIRNADSIKKAINAFKNGGGAQTPFADSLKKMRNNPEALQNIFNTKQKPTSYLEMTPLYLLLGPIWAMYRTLRHESGAVFFAIALLGTIGLTAIGGMMISFEVGEICLITALLIWTFAAIGGDCYIRSKFVDSCKLWASLEPHKQLNDYREMFGEKKSNSWWGLPILPILAWLSFSIILGVGIMSPQTGPNMPAIEQTIEQEVQSLEQTKPSAEDREAAIKVFERFYNSIANGDFRSAYACFSKDIQSQTTYDDWLPSAQRTVKSELRNEKIVSATADEISIQFTEHVQIDKDQAQDFEGVAVMKKEDSSWKIAGIAPVENPETEPAKTETPKSEAPKSEQSKAEAPKTEQSKAEQPKSEAPKAEPPKVEEKLDDKAEAIKVLNIFHESITAKNYKQAYDCFSDSFKNRVPYDGWAPGFKTTVSSIAVNPKVTAESHDSITIEYTLRAVDDPGGMRNFNSSVVMVRTANGWKINATNNKLK